MNQAPAEHRVIVTGASGGLGYHVLERFIREPGLKVLGLLRPGSLMHFPGGEVEYRTTDSLEKDSLVRIFDEFAPTCVVHLAASGLRFPKPQWFELIRFNVNAAIRLCECVSFVPDCHFVYIGTGLAYRDQGRPLREDDPLDTLHPYGASKAAGDLLVRAAAAEFGVPLTVLRPFSFTGTHDYVTRLFPMILQAAATGRACDLSPGMQVRDHCAARDVAAGILAAIQTHVPRTHALRIFNLGSGVTLPLRQMVEAVVADLELNVRLNFGARPYGKFESMYLAANIEHAAHGLKWTPATSLAYAVWTLSRSSFPFLKVKEPRMSP